MSSHDNKYFICRNAEIIPLLTLLIKEILANQNSIVVYYLVKNRTPAILERLSRLMGVRLSFVHIKDISRMKNGKGIPLTKATRCDDLYKVIGKLEQSSLKSYDTLSNRLNDRLKPLSEDLWLYIKQKIALNILDDLMITNVASWYTTNGESELSGKDVTLLLEKRNYWSSLIFDFAESRNVRYRTFPAITIKKNKAIVFIYFLGKLLFELLRSAVMLHGAPKPTNESKIGIPFYVMNNFTNFVDSRNYYLFWQYGSQIPPQNIMIYITEENSKIETDEVIRLQDRQFNIFSTPKHIAGDTNSLITRYTCSLRVLPLALKHISQIMTLLRNARNRDSLELWKLIAVLLIQLPYWEDFFQNNKIRIKFRFHDIFSVRDIAAKLSGVITLSYHYSNHSDTTIMHQDICDVFFIWGKRYEKCLSRHLATTKYIIQTGYVFDYIFDNVKNKAKELRDSFRTSSAAYIIALFDENMSGYLGRAQLGCYKALLEYGARNLDIGIIIKPKKETTIEYLKSSPEIYELITTLETQGRIKMLDNSKYPVVAGQASDLVIGVIPDSTAGLECALDGIPMVIYDCTNHNESNDLYQIGYDRIIFDNMDHLLNMISTSREKPDTVTDFAEWSLLLDDTDPFRDGKANQRIGAYINTLLLKKDEGATKDEAINSANEYYSRTYGKDKVISLH